jgi:predicted negative regulator of RcsB-dependent stress response
MTESDDADGRRSDDAAARGGRPGQPPSSRPARSRGSAGGATTGRGGSRPRGGQEGRGREGRGSGARGVPGGRGRASSAGGGTPRGGDRGGAGRSPGPDRRAEIEQRTYDPRREERRRLARVELPEDVEPRMLDGEVRRELRSLAKDTADTVARHLVVVGRTIDDEPEVALRHARAARAQAGRVGAVREASGLAAYAAGEWAEALTELRAARRITGSSGHLAVMADCERALGRPERALAYGEDPAVPSLSQEERVELVIVLSGARRDLGQADAAVVLLHDPARRTRRGRSWAPRLWYALADALLDAGRSEEARTWFATAAEADEAGETDAGERLLELDGVSVEDLQEVDDADERVPVPDGPVAAPVVEVAAAIVEDVVVVEDVAAVPGAPSPGGAATPDPSAPEADAERDPGPPDVPWSDDPGAG